MTHPTNIIRVAISLIDPFPNHPYYVLDNEDMINLAVSISKIGVSTPVLLWYHPDNGRYTLISGHRRCRGSMIAGIEDIPALIYEDITLDEATILMVDSNLNRENLLPSEKAFAYKMKLDAIKHQGVASSQVGKKLLSIERVGEESGESRNQVHRYIRLTYLIPEMLLMVDDQRLPFMVGVDLSYLTDAEQRCLLKEIEAQGRTPNLKQSKRYKELSKSGKLDSEVIADLLSTMRLDDRISFRIPPSSLEKLKFESEGGNVSRSQILRSYVNTGGKIYVGDDIAKEIYGIHTDIARTGNLLKLTANRLRDVCDNPFIADKYLEDVLQIIEQNKILQDEFQQLKRKLLRALEKLNKRIGGLNNGDI